MADFWGRICPLEKSTVYRCLDRCCRTRGLVVPFASTLADLFGARLEVLLYDLTSTYFDSAPPEIDEDKRRWVIAVTNGAF